MAYIAKCDSATPSKWWVTGTGTGGVNRLSVVLTDNPSGVLINGSSPDTYVAWSTFVTELIANGLYRIHLPFDVGDGSTATTLTSLGELVWFDDGSYFRSRANAVLTLATLSSSYGLSGSSWSISPNGADILLIYNGTLNIYASQLNVRTTGYCYLYGGQMNLINATLDGNAVGKLWIGGSPSAVTAMDSYISNFFALNLGSATVNRLHVHKCGTNFAMNGGDSLTGAFSSAPISWDVTVAGTGSADWVDPVAVPSLVYVWSDGLSFKVRYTRNIEVVKPDGTLFDDEVTVTCKEDSGGTQLFSVQTSSGAIPQQVTTYKEWVDTYPSTVNTYTHTFTLSAPGYQTRIIPKVPVNAPIKWRLELQKDPAYLLPSVTKMKHLKDNLFWQI